jgi:uncharacterized protein
MTEMQGGGHFPGRAAIEAYGNGGFRFAGMSHRGSILCLPSGIWAWDATTPADLTAAGFARLLAETAPIDMLLVGTGPNLVPLAERLKMRFREKHIQADSMATGAAVRTYNILLAENRRVAGAFLAVEA